MSSIAMNAPAAKHEHNKWLYVGIAILAIAVLVWGVAVYRQENGTPLARDKANELVATLEAQGLAAPTDIKEIARTLGEDGGAVCAHPGGALNKATANGLQTSGAAGPGLRPIQTSQDIVQAEAAVLTVYCPDQLAGFQRYVNGQRYADVIRE